ncbi:MAG: aldehyde dehydrogenase [Candidatus Thermoplasmatota archaeon]
MSEGFGWLQRDREVAQRDLARAYGHAKRDVQAESVPRLSQRIGGRKMAPASGAYLDNVDPARNVVLCKVPRGNAEDVDAAVVAATKAQPSWASLELAERCRILRRTAELIERDLDRLARMESEDTGKPIRLARTLDIPRAARNFRFYADFLEQRTEPEFHSDGWVHSTSRTPVGVVGLVTPWNLPLYLLTWKVAPALGLGNAVVAKPSELTPRTADALADLLAEAGLPDGLYNVVQGLGPEAGDPLIRNPDVRAVSFTGGTATGAKVAQAAASGPPKKLSLELGGKNPAVVFADCDLDAAVAGVVRGGFTNGGQVCLCTSRVLVEQSLLAKFLSKLEAAVKALKVGDPRDEATDIGPLNSLAHRTKVEGYLDLARKEAKVFCGGDRPTIAGELADGAFLTPALVTGVVQESRLIQEEIFGPVVTVQSFRDEAEAIALANGVRYGLTATVWTKDATKARRVAERLETGMVWVNCWLVRDLATAFGGSKESGVGREGGEWSVDFYSEAKNITMKET